MSKYRMSVIISGGLLSRCPKCRRKTDTVTINEFEAENDESAREIYQNKSRALSDANDFESSGCYGKVGDLIRVDVREQVTKLA